LGKTNIIFGRCNFYREDILEVRDLTIKEGLTEVHLHSFRDVEEIQFGHGERVSLIVFVKEINSTYSVENS
jgi:hypothetical protein